MRSLKEKVMKLGQFFMERKKEYKWSSEAIDHLLLLTLYVHYVYSL